MINDAAIARVRKFHFIGSTINEALNYNSHCSKKISGTLSEKNRLKRYLPFYALNRIHDSLILSQSQFGITCWGLESSEIVMLEKRAMRIMTFGKYKAHSKSLFKITEITEC